MTQQLATRPLGDALGLEVTGVDLSTPVPDGVFDEIKEHFWRNPVLVFRGQDLDAHKVAAVGRRFGPLQLHVLIDYRHEEVPEVSWLTNVKKDGSLDALGYKRATTWHSDGTFEERPPAVAILHAKEIPSKGGGTMFCNMIRAYETLPDETRERIGGLTGRHLYAAGPGGNATVPLKDFQKGDLPEVHHPVVRTHPESGRKMLYVNSIHTFGFVEIEGEEGETLLNGLLDHATKDEFVYHHRWRPGDVVMWDERATMHRGAGDYAPDERRIMLRTISYGERPQ